MEFLKWLLSLRVDSSWIECGVGIAIAVGVSLGIAITFSPVWLTITIPVGVFMAFHGYWRGSVKDRL